MAFFIIALLAIVFYQINNGIIRKYDLGSKHGWCPKPGLSFNPSQIEKSEYKFHRLTVAS